MFDIIKIRKTWNWVKCSTSSCLVNISRIHIEIPRKIQNIQWTSKNKGKTYGRLLVKLLNEPSAGAQPDPPLDTTITVGFYAWL